jgi:hypothetical protein
MRHIIIITILFGLTNFTYSQTIEKEFVGEWKLIETMSDPGDGSGKFHKIDSEKTLKIEPNGKIKSNGELCYLSTTTENRTNGQLIKDSNETILKSCDKKYKPIYKLTENFIIVYYPCKEGCAEKYEKKR